jgi:formylglycine-generating enzyme required for sulfatase activity
MTEVTYDQIRAYLKDHPQRPLYGGESDSPANNVDWFQAVRYCNRLSAAAKIDPREWCYPEPTDAGLSVPAEAIDKEGFRLPTEAEWEYIGRALTETARYYGESQELLSRHAWTGLNPEDRTHPVGRLLPNEFGMFDILGNVWEWCHDGPDGAFPNARMPAYPPGTPGRPASDLPGPQDVRKQGAETTWRMLRGGAFNYAPVKARSAHRDWIGADDLCPHVGFRVVRTLPDATRELAARADARRLDAGPSTSIARGR